MPDHICTWWCKIRCWLDGKNGVHKHIDWVNPSDIFQGKKCICCGKKAWSNVVTDALNSGYQIINGKDENGHEYYIAVKPPMSMDDIKRSTKIQTYESDERIFTFKTPISPEIEIKADKIICRYEPLDLLGAGETKEKAIESMGDDLEYSWDEIASKDDDLLEEDERKLKYRLLEAVEVKDKPPVYVETK